LHSFNVALGKEYKYFNETLELILQNPNFTYNIKNLTLTVINILTDDNTDKFLRFLCSNCNSISSICFYLSAYGSGTKIEKILPQIIENLKKVSFVYNILHQLLLLLKSPKCSNTLNTIAFYDVDFEKNIVVLSEAFNQLNVLESIHIVYCRSIDTKFINKLIILLNHLN
jgi:hypothetical protein